MGTIKKFGILVMYLVSVYVYAKLCKVKEFEQDLYHWKAMEKTFPMKRITLFYEHLCVAKLVIFGSKAHDWACDQ